MIYNFDASAVIHFWDNYPIENAHFRSIWNWFIQKINDEIFTISEMAMQETKHKIPYFINKLNDINNSCIQFKEHKKTMADLEMVTTIKEKLGIDEENYNPKGVGENDLLIIAIAKRTNSILVSNEAVQNNLPKQKANYKIPAVCGLPMVDIECIDFTNLLKRNL